MLNSNITGYGAKKEDAMVKLNEVLFSDIYITPEKTAYIPDNVTENGLEVLEA